MPLRDTIKNELDRLRTRKDKVLLDLAVARQTVADLDFVRDQIVADIAEAKAWIDANGGE